MKESLNQKEEISPKQKVAKKKYVTKQLKQSSKKQLQKGDASSALHSSIQILDDNFPLSSTATFPGAFTAQVPRDPP